MEININEIYTLNDGTELVCLDKGMKYWFFAEIDKRAENKATILFDTIRAYEADKVHEGHMVEEERDII